MATWLRSLFGAYRLNRRSFHYGRIEAWRDAWFHARGGHG